MSSNSFTFTSYESSEDVIFTPVQGSEASIQARDNQPGWLYFATDTGKIYLDAATGERITLGGSGASIYYGDGQATEDKVNVEQYYLPIDCLEDQKASPKVGDIILNSDGAFYKILRIENSNFVCSRLAVSGSGDGTVTQKIRPTIRVTNDLAPNIING